MNIRINDKKYNIKPISKLSVLEYMAIVKNMRYLDLVSYISAVTGIEIESKNVSINNIDAAEASLLDVNIDFTEIKKPLVFDFLGQSILTDDLDDGVFGKRYMFNIYRKQYDSDNIDIYELCVYALSVCLSKQKDFSDIDDVFLHLTQMPWMLVLPTGFFLCKKLSSRRSSLIKFFLKSIVKLHYLTSPLRPRPIRTT